MSLRNLAKSALRPIANMLLSSADSLPPKISNTISDDPAITAKFLPFQPNTPTLVLSKQTAKSGVLPLPPKNMREGYDSDDDAFLKTGREDISSMLAILDASGMQITESSRVMELGCATGRMLRHLESQARQGAEVWGVDITAESILWCQQNLYPPFRFCTSTTLPHLPFEDNYFDVIYAGSVFTHIFDLWDMWLMELKRIIKPGGCLYLTIHDQSMIEAGRRDYPDHWLTKQIEANDVLRPRLAKNDWTMFTIGRTPKSTLVYYDTESLKRMWGQYLDVVSIHPQACGPQTAVLLRK